MEMIARYISLGAAACFLGTAAFLFGRLYAANDLSLLPYLTFSDFVNFAPAMLLANGIFLGALVIADTYTSIIKHNIFRWILIGLMFAGWGIVVYLGGKQMLSLFGLVFITATILYAALQNLIRKNLGTEWVLAYSSFTTFLVFAVLFGNLDESNELNGSSRYSVTIGSATITASSLLPLDRGLAILQVGQFLIVPWPEVKQIKKT